MNSSNLHTELEAGNVTKSKTRVQGYEAREGNTAYVEPVPVSVSSMLRSSGSDLGGILFRSSTQIGASPPTALASSLAFLLMAFLAFTSACMEANHTQRCSECLNWPGTDMLLIPLNLRSPIHL